MKKRIKDNGLRRYEAASTHKDTTACGMATRSVASEFFATFTGKRLVDDG